MSPGPLSNPLGSFRKFAEIIANECLSAVPMTPAINCLAVSTSPAINFSPVSLTLESPAYINNQKAKNLSPVSTTPPKNCSAVSTTPAINFSAVSATPAIRESCLYKLAYT